MYLTDYFVRNYRVKPEITHLMNNLEFILVPFVNPDGYVVRVVLAGMQLRILHFDIVAELCAIIRSLV